MAVTACPCASGARYADCCGRFHAGQPAPDPQALMRSRYSAFALSASDPSMFDPSMFEYLRRTWHPDTCPPDLGPEASPPRWLGLKVIDVQVLDATHATVEFVARYKLGGRAHRLHEISRFVRQDGCWLYVAGRFPDPPDGQA